MTAGGALPSNDGFSAAPPPSFAGAEGMVSGTAVMYENDLRTNGTGTNDGTDAGFPVTPGLTVYDDHSPTSARVFHGTDKTSEGIYRSGESIVTWQDIDYDIGGVPGATDRSAYILGGFDMPDAHDFRGDHPLVIRRDAGGSYGDAGNSGDYPTEYNQGLAAESYNDPTDEDSWNAVSLGY
jgi:hypothetical protein